MTCGTQWPIGRLHEAFFLFLWLVFIQNCLNSHHMYLCICMCVYICKYGFTYVHFVFCTLVFFFLHSFLSLIYTIEGVVLHEFITFLTIF